MVQQLSLVASIPHNKYLQTASTLQALTGIVVPQDISTYTLLSKPYPEFKPKLEPGKVNQIEQYYMRCITTWDDNIEFDISKPILKSDPVGVWASTLFKDKIESDKPKKRNWTLQIADIPIAGKNQTCCTQTIYESTVVHHHTRSVSSTLTNTQPKVDADSTTNMKSETNETLDKAQVDKKVESAPDVEMVQETSVSSQDSFLEFLQDLGYDLVNQYWIKGVRYIHGDIFIELFKVFIRDDDFETKNNKIKLKLLDSTNTFQVRVYINVPKATDVELINQGTRTLAKFQESVKNLMNLEIPDRMYMDTRVINKS